MDPRATHLALDTLLAHREWVRRVARALARDDDAADEIEQRTWLAAIESPPRTADAPRAWLGTVLRRAASRLRRGDARRARREEAVARPEATASVADRVAEAECHERVVRAVLALPEPYRGTVVLRYFDGLPPREIALRMDVSPDTVQTRLRRAKELLREALDEDGRGRLAILAPLLAGDGGRTTTGTAATAAGATAMTMAAWKVGAVAAAAALAWLFFRSDDAKPSPDASPESAAAPDAARAGRDPKTGRAPRVAAAETDAGDAAAAAPTTQADVELRVRVARVGSACVGAVVLACRDGKVLARATTDASGAAVLALQAGDADVVALPAGSPPVRVASRAPGETVVEAAPGVCVSGIVRVGGAAPRAPVRLMLRTLGHFVAPESVPLDVWSSLEADYARSDQLATLTDAMGRFRFDGIAPGEVTWLRPEGHCFEGGGHELRDLRAPRDGLVLDLVRLPVMRGRVVEADGRTPVPLAFLLVRFDVHGDGEDATSFAMSVGRDGRFEVTFPAPDSKLVGFDINAQDGHGSRDVVPPPVVPADGDVGDIALAATRTVEFVVRDDRDRPVAGAAAVAVGRGKTPGVPSDAQGKGRVFVPTGTATIRVAAPGFEPREIETPQSEAPLVVRLVPAARLLVCVPGGSGRFNLRIECDEPMFRGEDGRPDHALLAAGATDTYEMTRYGDGRSDATFPLRPDGRLAIDGLRDGVPLRMELFDALGVVVARAEVRLAPREPRDLVLTPSSPPRRIVGVVRGPGGRPVAAEVGVEALARPEGECPSNGSLRAGPDGRFALDGVCEAEVVLRVRAGGLVPFLGRRAVPQGGEAIAVDLVAGRTVKVLVVDGKGGAVEDAVVDGLWSIEDVPDGATSVHGYAKGAGVFELTGVPFRECRVQVRAGDERAGTATLAAGQAEVRVEVK